MVLEQLLRKIKQNACIEHTGRLKNNNIIIYYDNLYLHNAQKG